MDEIEIKAICDKFFSNPFNRLVMNMLAVHDGEMTIKEACDNARLPNAISDDIVGDKLPESSSH